jgi:hypothetical protein
LWQRSQLNGPSEDSVATTSGIAEGLTFNDAEE